MSILSSFVGYAWLLWIYYIYSFTRCVWMDRLTALIHTGGICSSFSLWFCVCARVCICWIACWTAHFFWCMRICELYDCDYVHTCFECSPSQFTILYTHTLNHSFINLQDRLNDGHTTIAVHNIKLIFIMNKLVCKNVYTVHVYVNCILCRSNEQWGWRVRECLEWIRWMLSLSIGLGIKVYSLITTYRIEHITCTQMYSCFSRERTNERMNLRITYLSNIDDMVA